MTNDSGIEVVVFDYGGVLTLPVGDAFASWMAADGVEPASFSRTLKAWLSRTAAEGTPIHQLELGNLTADEFGVLLAAELATVDGRPVEPAGLLGRMFGAIRPDEAMFDLVEALRDAGIRVALLSNSWANTYPRPRIDELFDPIIISGEVRLRKPHAAIYELALERLGVSADRVVFVDDAEPNVLGARAVGMHALQHADAASTRDALSSLIPQLDIQVR